jgi:hypothetical protein
LSFASRNNEGHGAPRGAVCIVSLPASRAKRWSPEAHRLAALHSRRFWARGPYFRMGRANLIRSAFAAFIRIPCSRERQSHVVGPDGDSSLPDDVCARHARRRRILLRFKAPSRSAPHEQDDLEYIPRSEKCQGRRHSGGRARSERAEFITTEGVDSGPAPGGAPGMTERESLGAQDDTRLGLHCAPSGYACSILSTVIPGRVFARTRNPRPPGRFSHSPSRENGAV